MHTNDRRFQSWLDFTGDLLRQPMATFPRRALSRELSRTFQDRVSWNWVDADGSSGFEMEDQPVGWPEPSEVAFWREALGLHPLIRWYAVTEDPAAMSIGRVPDRIVPCRGFTQVREHLGPVGLDQQLAIPYRLGHGWHRSFVVSRTGADFSAEQVSLARRLQPLLALLAGQVSVLVGGAAPRDGVASSGLSCRERAVLQLLSEGHTAIAIAHRLAVSPRTVHKHLEHIYRKLHVTDRLVATRVAQEQGLVRKPATVPPR